MATALAGRHRELAELRELISLAAAGRGGLLVLVGPAGVGTTALADAAADEARALGIRVLRAGPVPQQPAGATWSLLLRDAGAPEPLLTGVVDRPDARVLDDAARRLVAGGPKLLIVDDVDRSSRDAAQDPAEPLALLAARAPGSSTAIVATSRTSLGIGHELVVRPLARRDLESLFPDLDEEAREALWLGSLGRPGVARRLAVELDAASVPETPALPEGPVVHLALHLDPAVGFLDADPAVVALLEAALTRPVRPATRARLSARLARELLGDASQSGRRRELADEALRVAREVQEPTVLAEVLDARMHALWDAAGAPDRLEAASEMIELADAAGDTARSRDGQFWRFAALLELARVLEAEAVLAAYTRACEHSGDIAGTAMATARASMLATMRGRFEEAAALAARYSAVAASAGLPDADALGATLHAAIEVERGSLDLGSGLDVLASYARRHPGQLYEATVAFVLAATGQLGDARSELERCLPAALSGTGPRWLRGMAELAVVAVWTDDLTAASTIHRAMLPYRDRIVVSGGANSVLGPASRYLGMLALKLGRIDEAIELLEAAAALETSIGALPGLANTSALLAIATARRGEPGDEARSGEHARRSAEIAANLSLGTLIADRIFPPDGEWTLVADDGDWLLQAGAERVRLRDGRGVQFLRALLANPGRDIAALELAGGGGGLRASSTDPVVDESARAAYRRRLTELDEELDAADRAGDGGRAIRAAEERDAIVAELARATGLGGRTRAMTAEDERARVNVTRTLRATIGRIADQAPLAATHLRASIRTGSRCRYEPAAGGPTRWRL